MKDAIIDVPAMYADHHVIRVREILLDMAGVEEVKASAARRKVALRFDEGATSVESITKALASAGYQPGQAPVLATHPKRHEDGSSWNSIIGRSTVTERKDREMAGDFRRY